ncbi:putative aldouronate transport system substrate-binding protein [Anaerocolumna jejuensis DSM 15929]|uniref:Putative aldouronate transport system substrate-binding protein n=1 Tax=Anaerocolumna jejuensis DSM 15929 TaxID=1121322 RepID=A0A1M6Z829_9FIRM|nr:extracellular solute-binding protein [Anaerocolumna jejuensis]SHL26595.1 putative aldouronate transport system substrate-binding protein [Anaerocolumna jejuensis DSM 15929]
MKSLLKKFTAVTLSIVMVLGMTACKEKSSSTVSQEITLTDSGTYPIVADGKNITLTCFTMTMPNVEDLQTNDFTKFLEEKTGIHIEFETGTRDDWEDKLNMSLQSGDYPDIIMGVSPNIAKYGVKEGIFIKLDNYINEKNTPNYYSMFKDNLDLSRESDGSIYSLLSTNDCYHCSYGRKMWINTKYLADMGCEIPQTTQEFYDVCKKFLEYKPNGIAIGGTAPGAGWYSTFQEWLMGSFLLSPSKSYTLNVNDMTAVNKEGKIVTAATDDRYKKYLEYCNSLYKLGAIYDGDFTQTQEQLKTIVNQEDAPVLCFPEGTISDYIDSAANPDLYKQYATLSPLEGPDGTRLTSYFKYSAISSGNFCITDKCKNPEAALRWVDFFYSKTGDLCSQYGADEGVDWKLNPEGKVGLNGEPALYEVLNPYSAETQNHDWQDIGIRVAPAAYRLGQAVDPNIDPYAPEGLEKLLYDSSKKDYEPYTQNESNSDLDMIPELKITDEESTNVSTIAVEVEKIITESSVGFITGAKDINTEWDSYKNSLDKSGLKTLLDTYQAAYDRMMKK